MSKVDGISFNKEWAKGKTEQEFVDEFMKENNEHIPTQDREVWLRNAYGKLVPKPVQEAQTTEPPADQSNKKASKP